MLNAKEALIELNKVFPDEVIETASEIDEFFVFNTRPKKSTLIKSTGIDCYFVDKSTKAVSLHSILDPALYSCTISKDYDPVTLKEIQ